MNDKQPSKMLKSIDTPGANRLAGIGVVVLSIDAITVTAEARKLSELQHI